MDTINIGMLLPTSTIFPVSKDLEKGLKEGLKPLSDKGTEFELVREFIAQGDVKLIESSCNKLFNYNNVDIVTGIISNRAALAVAERFKSQKVPFIISNPGGHIPSAPILNEYIFFNSMHLWRHAWSIGNWGVKTFGKKGMFIGSVYDAGYSFSYMMQMGMLAADPEANWSFSVPPMPVPGGLSDMSVIFPFIEEYQPDFIFAAFCGAETTLFLNEFISRDLHKRSELLGLPYLLSPFAPLSDDITIYTTQAFSNAPNIDPAKAFYHLGLQAGKVIAEAASMATDKVQLRERLAQVNSLFNVDPAQPVSPVAEEITIIKNTISANGTAFSQQVFASTPTLDLDSTLLEKLTSTADSGWFNPYLCI